MKDADQDSIGRGIRSLNFILSKDKDECDPSITLDGPLRRLCGEAKAGLEQMLVAEHGFAPSLREIGEGVGLKSSCTVNTHVCTLTHHGLIHRMSGKTRAISVTLAGLKKIGAE